MEAMAYDLLEPLRPELAWTAKPGDENGAEPVRDKTEEENPILAVWGSADGPKAWKSEH